MRRYALRRLLLLIPTLVGMSILVFGLSNLTPGDPAYAVAARQQGRVPSPQEIAGARTELGLDRPLVPRYLHWAERAARGDLGLSFSTRRSVRAEIVHRLPFTLQLAIPAVLLAVLLGVPCGIVSAARRNKPVDHVLRIGSLAAASIPSFWLALILVVVFAVKLSLVPVAGKGGLASFVLPTVTLAMAPTAVLARFTRSTMLEALGSDYIRTARAKGASQYAVVLRHALRNSLIPVVTALGNSFGALLAGATVIETVFVWPGIGRLMVEAILERDFPMVEGLILYSGAAFVLVSLVVDLSYALLDPRISYRDATR